MLKVIIELNQRDEHYCSPCLLVTDELGNSLPIVFPEDMTIEEGKLFTEQLKKGIEKEYNDINILQKVIYG